MSDDDPLAELIEVVRARIERQEERLAAAEAALAEQKRATIEALLDQRKEALAAPYAPGGHRADGSWLARIRSKVADKIGKRSDRPSESADARTTGESGS